MHPLFQKKRRILALLGLTLMTQCCCIVVPMSARVEQNAIQVVIEDIREFVQSRAGAEVSSLR